MARMLMCAKLGIEAEGLDRAPLPGKMGERVFNSISKDAWQQWLRHQTILINENKLSAIDPKHREFIEQEMEKFLFEGGAELPEEFTPEDK